MTAAVIGAVEAAAPPIPRRRRPVAVYVLAVVVGVAAFLYPFWLPDSARPATAHATDAPMLAAAVGALVIAAVGLELRRGTMTGATIAVLGVLAAAGGLLRLLDPPGGGSGIFFVIVLAGAAFGARFGLLCGMAAMATSAVVTGGIGPWLPFQMLALGWIGAGAGLIAPIARRAGRRAEIVALAGFGWLAGFLYGAVMNLWFWPFAVGDGPLSWNPALSIVETLSRYWSFYVATSLAWDAAGAMTNVVLIGLTGRAVLTAFHRVAHRLDPVVELVD